MPWSVLVGNGFDKSRPVIRAPQACPLGVMFIGYPLKYLHEAQHYNVRWFFQLTRGQSE